MNAIEKYINAGISIIPVDSNKMPLGEWKQYQTTVAGPSAYNIWSLPIAAIGGKVSGGLACIDFDDKGSKFPEWCQIVKDSGFNIKAKTVIQQTPSGGWHVIFRTKLDIRNKKLAMRLLPDNKKQVLIETRGEGGYFLITPSDGYVLKNGDPSMPVMLDDNDVDLMLSSARSLTEEIREHSIPKTQIALSKTGITPFDDYDSRTSPVDVMCSYGWQVAFKKNEKVYLRRPDKNKGLSATWNHVPNRLYVFSTSTVFENETVYKPSAVYAILEHNGDYTAAAKALYSQGYGSRVMKQPAVNLDMTPITMSVKMSEYREQIYDFYKSGKFERGVRLGLPSLDNMFRFEKGYLNIITGISTHGKSEFLDWVLIKLAQVHGWQIEIFSPENFPLEIHYDKLAAKFHDTCLINPERYVIDEGIDFIDEHFEFINATEEDLTLEAILSSALEMKQRRGLDALVLDPWNEIELSRPRDMSETDYTGECLRKLRKFARKNNLCLWIVVHPTKMQRKKDTDAYPVPSMYDISGSSHWYNKADNGIVVYRDFDKNITEVYIKKVKYRHYGKLGVLKYSYDTRSGNFIEIDEKESEQTDWFGKE